MSRTRASLDETRARYAQRMAAASGSDDPRIASAFAQVPREAFLPPGPWKIMVNGRYVETPDADPAQLYHNVLVALDARRRINNGEPFLHAAWLGAVAPKAGEHCCHIGVGGGYYTAILSVLVSPGGRVDGFEIDEGLAVQARANLAPFGNARVIAGDATILPIPPADLIYVNAAVSAPPASWLQALRPGGRMIFPWRPGEGIGLAMLLRRAGRGFAVKPLSPAWFIPCAGASGSAGCTKTPDWRGAHAARSVWLNADRAPDGTAVAAYGHMWFSAEPGPFGG